MRLLMHTGVNNEWHPAILDVLATIPHDADEPVYYDANGDGAAECRYGIKGGSVRAYFFDARDCATTTVAIDKHRFGSLQQAPLDNSDVVIRHESAVLAASVAVDAWNKLQATGREQ